MIQSVVRDIRFLLTDTVALAMVLLLLVASMLAWWLRRTGRTKHPYPLLGAAFSSIAVILAVTLFRDPPAFTPARLFNWSTSGWERISYDPLQSSEILLNLALFLPAGIAWTILTGRPLRVLVGLACLSFLIECLQAVTSTGANDVADLLSNTVGAALGVAVGTVLRWLIPWPEAGSRPSRREFLRVAGAVVVFVVTVVVGLNVGAEHRQSALERELTSLFAETTLAQYRTWETEDRLIEEVFGVASVFADGARYGDDVVQIRYPASFFGLNRCVFVEWRSDDVQIIRGSGAECRGLFG